MEKVVQSYNAKHGRAVTRYEFSALFADAWYSSMIPKNIHGRFKTCGVFPFSRHAVHLPLEEHASFKPEEVVNKFKLKYIPLYSPAPVKRCQVSCQTMSSLSSPQACSTVEKSMISRGALDKRHSYSESSLCDLESSLFDLSLKTPEVTRAWMQSPELCIMATKRISHFKAAPGYTHSSSQGNGCPTKAIWKSTD